MPTKAGQKNPLPHHTRNQGRRTARNSVRTALATGSFTVKQSRKRLSRIAGDFVTTDDGTGIVHTAPTFGADDAQVAKEATPPVPRF